MSVRRGTQLVISFPAVSSTARPTRKSGIVFNLASGDIQLSSNGSAFFAPANTAAEIGTSGRYALTLTAAEMNASWVHMLASQGSTIDPVDIVIGTSGHPSATVLTDAGNTASTFLTNLTETVNDLWKDNMLLFTTGGLANQVKKVSAYNGSTKFITASTAFTSAPANGDRFLLINL
mgnify:CR=1 FL=1